MAKLVKEKDVKIKIKKCSQWRRNEWKERASMPKVRAYI